MYNYTKSFYVLRIYKLQGIEYRRRRVAILIFRKEHLIISEIINRPDTNSAILLSMPKQVSFRFHLAVIDLHLK